MKLGGFTILLVVLALAGCTSTPTEPRPSFVPVTPEAVTPEPRVTPTKTPNARCVPVSEAMMGAIAAGRKSSDPMLPIEGVAVKSEDHKTLYMIAVSFKRQSGGSPTVGVWASESVEPGAPIYSVDGYAAAATGWPSGGDSSGKAQVFDDGVLIARLCVNA
jgi:hypothetical protein